MPAVVAAHSEVFKVQYVTVVYVYVYVFVCGAIVGAVTGRDEGVY